MKYLEEPKLSWLTSFLSGCEAGDRVLHGRLEAFSCKRSGTDKKLARELGKSLTEEVDYPPGKGLSCSPFGDIHDASTRKILINLIATMNASFPDYDFSNLRHDHFQCEPSLNLVMNSVNTNLAEFVEDDHNAGSGFLSELWSSIDQTIRIKDCQVYSYVPEIEADPFTENTLWSFNYFFYNRKEKKLLYFTCMAKSKFSESQEDMEELESNDDGVSTEENDVDMESESMGWEDDDL